MMFFSDAICFNEKAASRTQPIWGCVMDDKLQSHYSGDGDLSRVIAETLRKAGKDPDRLTTIDLASVDEFHIRGRKATLELAGFLNIDASSKVLDIGSGLGGPA